MDRAPTSRVRKDSEELKSTEILKVIKPSSAKVAVSKIVTVDNCVVQERAYNDRVSPAAAPDQSKNDKLNQWRKYYLAEIETWRSKRNVQR